MKKIAITLLYLLISYSHSLAITIDTAFYNAFCKEFKQEKETGNKFVAALHTASKKMFSFENDAFNNWLQREHHANNSISDSALSKEIIYAVLNRFVDNEFLACDDEISKAEKQLSLFVNYICDCTTKKMSDLNRYQKSQAQSTTLTGCLQSFMADSNNVRQMISNDGINQTQRMLKCGALYMFSKCPEFRNSMIDNEYAMFFSYRKNDVFEKELKLNKELNKGVMEGNINEVKDLFINESAHKDAVVQWNKCKKEVVKYKSNKHVKDISTGEKRLTTTWLINPGEKAGVLFQLSYELQWVAGKPLITNTNYIPANLISDKKIYTDRSTVIPGDEEKSSVSSDDLPPEVQEVSK